MADNIQVSQGNGTTMATDDVDGVQYPRVKVSIGVDGSAADVSGSNPMPVSGPLTDTQLRASAVPVSGPLTDVQLRASALPISGTVTANTGLSQPLTDTQLRSSAVSVSGPLTDTQLRANPVPVSGTVTANTGLSQPLTDAQLRATSVPISAASLPLPAGAATSENQTTANTSLASIDSKLTSPLKVTGALTNLPTQTDVYVPVRPLPQTKFRATFANVISSGVDSNFFNLIQTGSGQAVSQSAGNLVITSGTTTNSETVLRSTQRFSDSFIAKWTTILSQRIANQSFFFELVDVIGDGLALNVNSATSITVTIPSNPFTSLNVGQSMYVGVISGVSGAIPGRYAIASVSGNGVNFTVSGWPTSGTGTVSLFGWNYHQIQYSGTTATTTNFDAQRRGWNSGFTTATISSTAASGHMGIIQNEDGVTGFLDQLTASSTTNPISMRASRVQNTPTQEVPLSVQIRCLNGSTAPASTTTWTIGLVSVENYAPQSVSIHNVKVQSYNSPMPVRIDTGLAAGTNAIGDVGIQYRANAIGAASGAHVVSAASTNATTVKAGAGRVIGWSLANTNAAWRYVKLHNQTTTPTAGSGVVRTIAIPPNGVVNQELSGGIAFGTGIGLTTVTGAADSDTTAVGANDIVGDLFFL